MFRPEHGKTYKIKAIAEIEGELTGLEADLEFEEGKAFIIKAFWPTAGKDHKERIEIDPSFLSPLSLPGFDFVYRKVLVIGPIQDN